MTDKIYRTCEIKKFGEPYARCCLEYVNNNYVVVVLEDYEDIFVDFNLEINNNKLPEIIIKHFENECLQRFTCSGDFSIEQVKENSDEEISFY